MEGYSHDPEPLNPNSPEYQLDGEPLRDLADLHHNWWLLWRQAGQNPAFDELRSAIGDLQIIFTGDLGERVEHHPDVANTAVDQLSHSEREADLVLASSMLYHCQRGLAERGEMTTPEAEAERWRSLLDRVSSYDALEAVAGDARSVIELANPPQAFIDHLVRILSEASRLD